MMVLQKESSTVMYKACVNKLLYDNLTVNWTVQVFSKIFYKIFTEGTT